LGWIIRHTAHEIQHHRLDLTTILAKVEPPIVPKPKSEPSSEAEPSSEHGAEAAD
jgi:hypothetical protein